MEQMTLFDATSSKSTLCSNKDWVGNAHSVVGCLGASNHSATERQMFDFYATDPKAAEWLLKLETFSHDIWEPAAGQGHLWAGGKAPLPERAVHSPQAAGSEASAP